MPRRRERRPGAAHVRARAFSLMFQPVGIKKLTNVAVVRLKTHGARFEIACYKNTVLSFRRGHEKDVDNVLQTTEVYANVSKGVVARDDELVKAFGHCDRGKICVVILERGELQVSELERKAEAESAFRDCVTTLAEKCVNPSTKMPYPPGMIESALRDIHFSIDSKRSAKQQALEALPKLQTIFPIRRAEMRFSASVPIAKEEVLMEFVRENKGTIESSERTASEASATFTMDPSTYRPLDKLCKDAKGRLEVVTLAVMEQASTAGSFNEGTLKATVAKQTAMEKAEEALAKIEISRPATQVVVPKVRRSEQVETLSSSDANILVPRGPISELPEEYASRKERFADIDTYEPGWEVELRSREGSSIVDAVFYSPRGELCKTYADARRKAMVALK